MLPRDRIIEVLKGARHDHARRVARHRHGRGRPR
jgi:hypothetical protein